MTVRRVRKRDGREVPFDKTKVEAAVVAAQTAVGEEDPQFASEVADVVELALNRRAARSPAEAVPDIETIQDLVEQALIELGRAPVAKAYILYRDKRTRIRDVLQVHDDRGASERLLAAGGRRALERPSERPQIRVRESESFGTWSKGRIVAALMNEADLPREIASTVAAAVEERVFASGLRRISTALIRELVDNELVSMGLAAALERQGPVGVSRHDLRALVADPGFESEPEGPGPVRVPRRVEDAIAGEVLRRYALEDLLDERLAELHLTGELHLEDVAHPHLDLVRSIPSELLATGEGAADAFGLLENLAGQLRGVASGVVLEDVATPLAPLVGRGTKGDGDALAAWVVTLRALSRASGRRVDLVPFAAARGTRSGARGSGAEAAGARGRAAIGRLIEHLAHAPAVDPPGLFPRLFVDGEDLAALLEGAPELEAPTARLLGAGALVPTWGRPSERFAGPGLRRAPHERGALACAAAAGLNLTRLARRAGPWREDRFLELALELVRDALDALAQLAAFRRERRAGQASALSERAGYAIVPVGLSEALRWLGDGEVRAAQGARLVGVLDDAVRRSALERGLVCTLTPFFGRAAGARFALLDAELFQASQGLLFTAAPGSTSGTVEPPPTVAYGSGYALSGLHQPAAAVAAQVPGEREGELVGNVVAGALHPPLAGMPARAARLRGEELPALSAWRRFEERRTRAAETAPEPVPDRARAAERDLTFDEESTPVS